MNIVKMFKKSEGFTLVELMVVVLIIGILVAIAVPVFNSAKATAQVNTCKANQRTILGAVQMVGANNLVTVPTEQALLDTSTTSGTWPEVLISEYIKSAPKCPATNAYYALDTDGTPIGDGGTLTSPAFTTTTSSHKL